MKSELIEYMGSDLTVVNAARVSFSKESDWEPPVTYHNANGTTTVKSELKQGDAKLINYLAKHNHWTPFSHPQIMMREKVPIFVARQRFKHMVGFTYNEVSRRYVDDEPEFFVPDVWRSRPEGSVKQGSGDKEITGWEGSYQEYCQRSLEYYQDMLADGVAPEQARMVLPQSMYTEYYVTGSLSAWARAYKQRIDAHAQVEIQDLAKQWGEIIAPLFPKSWEALTNE